MAVWQSLLPQMGIISAFISEGTQNKRDDVTMMSTPIPT